MQKRNQSLWSVILLIVIYTGADADVFMNSSGEHFLDRANGWGQTFTPGIGTIEPSIQIPDKVYLIDWTYSTSVSGNGQTAGDVYLVIFSELNPYLMDASNMVGVSSNAINMIDAGKGVMVTWNFDELLLHRDTEYALMFSKTPDASGILVSQAVSLELGNIYSGGGWIRIDNIANDWDAAYGATYNTEFTTFTAAQSDGSTSVTEGGADDTYTIELLPNPDETLPDDQRWPTGDVTVVLNTNDQIALSPASIVFSSWTGDPGDYQVTCTVSAIDDTVSEGPQIVTITHSVSSTDVVYDDAPIPDIQVAVADNEPYCGDENTVFLTTDLNRDCYVNLTDLAMLAFDWMQCTDPTDINCYPNIPAEPKFETDVFTSTGITGGTVDDPAHMHRIPAMVCTSSGVLVAVSDARVNSSSDLPSNIDVSIRRSFDNGTTWTPLEIIVDYPGYEGAGDPCILIDRQSKPETIYIFYIYGPEGIGLFQSQPGLDGPYTCRIEYVKSTDDGTTWSAPVDINPMVKNPAWSCAVASPGVGLQMREGTLVVPAYYKTGGTMHSYFFYSDDHGSTWQYKNAPGELQLAATTTECAVVELNDGSLMLNMRNHWGTGHRVVSTTMDMGQTWTLMVSDDELPDPVCQGTLIRISDTRDGDDANRLLFANAASISRSNGTVKMSYDQGETWSVAKQIYAGSYAYSCLADLKDGNIGLLYEADNYSRIVFARFSVKWLTDGRDFFLPGF